MPRDAEPDFDAIDRDLQELDDWPAPERHVLARPEGECERCFKIVDERELVMVYSMALCAECRGEVLPD